MVVSELIHRPPKLAPLWRVLLFGGGASLAALLVVAATLKPSQRGYGTHQQLGLPPCTFVMLLGHRCPACGMTTAWAHLVRAQPIAALRANVGGALLGLAAIVLAPWLLASAMRGRWLGHAPSDRVVLGVALALVLVTVIDWGIRFLW